MMNRVAILAWQDAFDPGDALAMARNVFREGSLLAAPLYFRLKREGSGPAVLESSKSVIWRTAPLLRGISPEERPASGRRRKTEAASRSARGRRFFLKRGLFMISFHRMTRHGH
jgi:hypothetical protein